LFTILAFGVQKRVAAALVEQGAASYAADGLQVRRMCSDMAVRLKRVGSTLRLRCPRVVLGYIRSTARARDTQRRSGVSSRRLSS
jgi:hypothetical protein